MFIFEKKSPQLFSHPTEGQLVIETQERERMHKSKPMYLFGASGDMTA